MTSRAASIALLIGCLGLTPIAGAETGGGTAKRNEDCFTRAILCGETVRGALTNRDCNFTDGSFGDRWLLAASEGESVELSGTAGFPGELYLRGDELAVQGLAPGQSTTLNGTYTIASSGFFAALITSTPPGNALDDYSLSLSCEFANPCYHTHLWQGCAGHRINGPPSGYMVQVAFEDPVSHHDGFAMTISNIQTVPGTYTSFPDAAAGLVTRFYPRGDGVELRYYDLTDFAFRMGVTDRSTGESRFYTGAPTACGDATRHVFPAANGEGAGCRPYNRGRRDLNTGCVLGKRFSVTLAWTNPANGKRGKGRVLVGGDDDAGRISFPGTQDYLLGFRFKNEGDHVTMLFGSLSDWPYTLQVVDTQTGEVWQHQNAPGQVCGEVDHDVFGQ